MFPILFIEYSRENILEFIHSSCRMGLLREKKEVLNNLLENTWSYYVLMQNLIGNIAF